jgi:NAD(P)-dependent dehydrogenase (short-subunit alcohol dehydrogenase family)
VTRQEDNDAQDDAMSDLAGRTTIVVGASRGLGHGIAVALAEAGAPVVAVSRTPGHFPEPAPGGGRIRAEMADAAEAETATSLLARHEPDVVVLVAGASPPVLPLTEQTWETFSVNWHADVRIAFHWLRAALRQPMRPGGRVVVLSSGAALAGSPLSGGYAGAKATQRLLAGYAQDEARRVGLGLTFTAVLPRPTPLTELGRAAVVAYAAREGLSEQEYVRRLGGLITPESAGAAVLDLLLADAAMLAPSYLLTASGPQPLP